MLAGYYAYHRGGVSTSTHNEFIFDAAHAERQLPGAIEAFWFPLAAGCAARCQAYAERMHATFLRQYRLTSVDVPLVGLRLDNWMHPFVVAPSAPRV